MEKLFCSILFLLLSTALSAQTNITGVLAESLYNLVPNNPIRHFNPVLMDIKVISPKFSCAKRFVNNNIDGSVNYKCLLPNKNSYGQIDIIDEAAQILFDALNAEIKPAEYLLEKIRCEAHGDVDNIIYHCIITP